MPEAKSTKLNIREDRPTALTSSVHGSNIDAIGFNLLFIAQRNPKLAVEIMKLYDLAHKVRENDPSAPSEDLALFAQEVAKVLADKSDE